MGDEEPLHKLSWTAAALADLNGLCTFIADDNPGAAERIGLAIIEHVQLLTRFPFIGPIYPPGPGGRIRVIVFRRTYRIFYSVIERTHTVEVLRIWHGSRDEPESLTPSGL